MGKRGRPFPDKEQRIKDAVYAAVPAQEDGRTLHDITEDVRLATGVDRTTVWRHLKRFEKDDLVVHEAKSYRRNPLPEKSLRKIRPDSMYYLQFEKARVSIPFRDLRRVPRALASLPKPLQKSALAIIVVSAPMFADWWWSAMGSMSIGHLRRGKLASAFELYLAEAIAGYLTLLEVITRAPSLSAAHELARRFNTSYVTNPLMLLARQVWECRKEFSLQELDGKVIRFTIVRKSFGKARRGRGLGVSAFPRMLPGALENSVDISLIGTERRERNSLRAGAPTSNM